MRGLLLLPAVAVVLSSLACTGGGTVATCDLTVDTLQGKAFVMSEAQPGAEDKLNPLARLTFVDEGGKTQAKYTAMSLGDIYTYDCEKQTRKDGKEELKCSEKARPQDWCEALLAWDAACSPKKMKKFGATQSDEELKKLVATAKKNKRAAEKNEDPNVYKRWKARRASLANKLQGNLYAKVDEKKCRLRIDDLYWTLYKGEKREDSNPVGTNPFVKADEPWMFEHCDNQADLWDLETDAFPTEALTSLPKHEVGKPIYFYHTGKVGAEAEEGCTYSVDTYAGWLPKNKSIKAEPKEGRVMWRAEHSYTDADVREINGKKIGIFHMTRYKECGGKKEKIDTACRATVFN